MAHFAKVVDGIVTQVVTADEDTGLSFLNDFYPGTWLQTSFNTRGGIHYGPDGLPDGLPGLRKNFATIGGKYDQEADAFYSDAPTLANNPQFELNRSTFLWQAVRKNTVTPRSAADTSIRIWMAGQTRAFLTPPGVANVLQSAGVMPARTVEEATHMFGSSDVEVSTAINDPSMAHLAPMSQQALFNLTDRIGQQTIGVKVLPSVLPRAPEDLDGKFPGPIFVKRRSTLVKDTSPLAYTRWATTAEFVSATDAAFWAEQRDSTSPNGAFIVQPALDEKLEVLDVFVSINAQSELIVWASLHSLDVGVNAYMANRKCTDTALLDTLGEELKFLALDQSLKAGIHGISYTKYNGEWCMFDWNLRSHLTLHMFAATHPIYAEAVAHMVGRPLDVAPELFYEVRCYDAYKLPVSRSREIVRYGMLIRRINTVGNISRVACVGYSEAEVTEKFTALEAWLDSLATK